MAIPKSAVDNRANFRLRVLGKGQNWLMVVHQPASAYQLLVPGGTPFAGSLPSRGDNGVTSFTFSIDPG